MQSPKVTNADYIPQNEKANYGPLEVMHSGAGYYVGTHYNNPEGYQEPGSRDSGYFRTSKEAEAELALMKLSQGQEPIDVSTREKLLVFMSGSESEEDWGNRCARVLAITGQYPDHWHDTINVTGLYDCLFGGDDT